jgi:hypothetical protein
LGSTSGSGTAAATCETIPYGDVTGNGTVDVDDLIFMLEGFSGRFGTIPFAFVDIHPCDAPDNAITVDDLSMLIQVLEGYPPVPCPDPCRPCVGNRLPVANAGPDLAPTQSTVRLSGVSSIDPDGRVKRYRWAFGDGESSGWLTEPEVSHTYDAVREYVATLWVEDDCSAQSNPDTVRVTISGVQTLNPQLVGYAAGGAGVGTAQGVCVSADGVHVYVGSKEFGVVKFDISNPADPVFVQSSMSFEEARGVAANHLAVVTGGAGGNMAATRVAAANRFGQDNEIWTPLGFASQDVALYGSTLVVAAAFDGLKIANITDPNRPTVTATFPSIFARGVALSTNGQRAYVAAGGESTGGGGFRIVNLTGSPSIIGSLLSVGGSNAGDIVLSADGTTAYLAENIGISVVDVRDPTRPLRVASRTAIGQPSRITRTGNVLAVATTGNNTSTLQLFDVGDRWNPIARGSYNGDFGEIAATGGYVFAAAGRTGLLSIDISDPSAPVLAKAVQSEFGERTACASDGALALVGGTVTAVSILDVTDPELPIRTAKLPLVAQDIAMFGQYAFLASGPSGLKVVDLGNPAQPVIRATVSIFARGVAVTPDGQWAIVAAGSSASAGRVVVVNVANRTSPAIAAEVRTSAGGNAQDIDLSSDGRLAFVGDNAGGLQVVDISNPRAPSRVGAGLPLGGLAGRVRTMGNLVLVAVSGTYGSGRIAIVDASNPLAMAEDGFYGGVYTGTFDVFGSYALLPNRALGLTVVDLSDPANPETVATVPTPGALSSVARFANFVYGGDDVAILDVFELFAP